MTFHAAASGHLVIAAIPELIAAMLEQLPGALHALPQEAEQRLYPDPSPDEPGLAEDWKAHVEPGLQQLFLEAREVAAADVRGMTRDAGGATLKIPIGHADAWLNTLNQARLALAETYCFSEEELAARPAPPFDDNRALVRLQIDFFATIQECLLELTEPL
jgi:hypothetical protein